MPGNESNKETRSATPTPTPQAPVQQQPAISEPPPSSYEWKTTTSKQNGVVTSTFGEAGKDSDAGDEDKNS